MEKFLNHVCFLFKQHKKKLIVMRNAILIILVCSLEVFAIGSYAQTKTISLAMNNATKRDVLFAIQNQSEFYFLYNSELIDVEEKVSFVFENTKVDEILTQLFNKNEVNVVIKDRYIILTPAVGKNSFDFSQQQQRTISGKVTDRGGQPLPGVTVVIKGTTQGTVTDINGAYSLVNIPEDATLVFSFVGMQIQEIIAGKQTNIDVKMLEDTIGIEEVVAIGYGSMKKSDLTGSVAGMRFEDISNRVATQTSTLLQGELSGVTVTQGSGEPGKDGATIRIRGLGTFSNAGNSPLVLIDGITGSINDVNPNDIKNVSVLKDASSAAIYGARAANGVILIETRSGETGRLKIDYNGYVGIQKPTETPQLVDSWTYAELYNEAMINEGKSPTFSQEDIQKFKEGKDLDNYPNFNRYKYLLDSGSGLQTEHDIRVSGGSLQNRYSLSMGYLLQEAMMIEQNSYERYRLRMNLDSKVGERVDLSFKLQANHTILNEPFPSATSLIAGSLKYPPTIPGRKSDGTYGHVSGLVMQAHLDSESFRQDKTNFFFSSIDITYKIFEDLTLTAVGGFRNSDNVDRTYQAEIIIDPNAKISPNYLRVTRGNTNYLTLQSFLKYSKIFKEHKFNVLAGYSQEENNSEWDRAYRDNFPSNSLYQINAGSAENMQANGTSSGWALQSYFGRIDYSFKGKYMAQFNSRYDGSSRFPKENRFDLFTSASAGWRISEEEFFNIPSISDLKIRASYGELGNQEVGLYPYQQTLELGKIYPIGGQLQPGISATSLPNRDLSWETTKVTDVGMDLVMWDGKLSITSDYFVKRTEGILYKISTSSVLGLTPTEQNAGIVENKGVDIQVSHNNKIKDFNYRISTNLSYVKNKVISLFNVERDIAKGLFVGEPINSIYGYVADGLFIDDADIENYATQPYLAKPGYIRLVDISGPDGKPDGIVTPEYDRKIIGNEFPKYNFGLSLSGDYKRFDFSVQFQGVAGIDNLLAGTEEEATEGLAFMKGSTPQLWMLKDRWTQDNPDRYAKYPRLETTDNSHPLNRTSTYWLRSAAFLRLNNLNIGYSIPVRKMSSLRVFFSGTNLFTIDGYHEGWDPESTRWYPPAAVYSLGLNASF